MQEPLLPSEGRVPENADEGRVPPEGKASSQSNEEGTERGDFEDKRVGSTAAGSGLSAALRSNGSGLAAGLQTSGQGSTAAGARSREGPAETGAQFGTSCVQSKQRSRLGQRNRAKFETFIHFRIGCTLCEVGLTPQSRIDKRAMRDGLLCIWTEAKPRPLTGAQQYVCRPLVQASCQVYPLEPPLTLCSS
jgi:hypothetical protein